MYRVREMIVFDVPRAVGAGLLVVALFTQAHIARAERGVRSEAERERGVRSAVLGFEV